MPNNMSLENTGRRHRAVLLAVGACVLVLAVACVDAGASPSGADPPRPSPFRTAAPPTSASPATTAPSAGPTAGGHSQTFVAAGRIARCDHGPTRATAALVERLVEERDATVLTLGDHAYPRGRLAEFERCYGATWGRFRESTHPVPGNHDYLDPGAAGYFAYFGPRAGTVAEGWYAFDAGTWRLVALNSECSEIGGCDAGSAQHGWLRDDLAVNPRTCSLAFWHRPVFASGPDGGQPQMAAILDLLHEHGADIVLTGDDHLYERLALVDADGRLDLAGVRMFNVGTGGSGLQPLERPPLPITEARSSVHGVLRLELFDGGYRWEFLPTMAGAFADAGTESCR